MPSGENLRKLQQKKGLSLRKVQKETGIAYKPWVLMKEIQANQR